MKLRVPKELSDKQIEEFQRIYKERFGKDISREDAIEEGLSLIRSIALIIDKDDHSREQKPSILKGSTLIFNSLRKQSSELMKTVNND
ncbi:MAG: hypothetical protein C0397_09935 [Odoribacter sp.]|nr:hypothetical protein [Odoribacter sp.]